MTTLTWIIIAFAATVGLAYFFAPKGWRTFFVNVSSGLAAVLVGSVEALRDVIPPEMMVYAIAVVNLLNLYLRMVTTSPIGKKG